MTYKHAVSPVQQSPFISSLPFLVYNAFLREGGKEGERGRERWGTRWGVGRGRPILPFLFHLLSATLESTVALVLPAAACLALCVSSPGLLLTLQALAHTNH